MNYEDRVKVIICRGWGSDLGKVRYEVDRW